VVHGQDLQQEDSEDGRVLMCDLDHFVGVLTSSSVPNGPEILFGDQVIEEGIDDDKIVLWGDLCGCGRKLLFIQNSKRRSGGAVSFMVNHEGAL